MDFRLKNPYYATKAPFFYWLSVLPRKTMIPFHGLLERDIDLFSTGVEYTDLETGDGMREILTLHPSFINMPTRDKTAYRGI